MMPSLSLTQPPAHALTHARAHLCDRDKVLLSALLVGPRILVRVPLQRQLTVRSLQAVRSMLSVSDRAANAADPVQATGEVGVVP